MHKKCAVADAGFPVPGFSQMHKIDNIGIKTICLQVSSLFLSYDVSKFEIR